MPFKGARFKALKWTVEQIGGVYVHTIIVRSSQTITVLSAAAWINNVLIVDSADDDAHHVLVAVILFRDLVRVPVEHSLSEETARPT